MSSECEDVSLAEPCGRGNAVKTSDLDCRSLLDDLAYNGSKSQHNVFESVFGVVMESSIYGVSR